jgi:hypothetical protein
MNLKQVKTLPNYTIALFDEAEKSIPRDNPTHRMQGCRRWHRLKIGHLCILILNS